MKVLHVLETSMPNTVGYTIRANAIITHQRRLGLDPVVVTSPFFATRDPGVAIEEIEGTRYYRTNHIPIPASARSKFLSYGVRLMMVGRYQRAVLEIARKERPDIIHAHSSYTNAYAALPAARRLGLPFVYEVRTLWSEAAVVEDGWRSGSLKHRFIWRLELGAMRRANLVLPICNGIREELMARGIASEKLRIVPNGVDVSRFSPIPRDNALAHSLGLSSSFTVGFVGSIRKLEGISLLLQAYRICQTRKSGLGLVIVGDGPDRKALEERAAQLGLTGIVFAGNVPHEAVSSWYSIMDVMVYPRIDTKINERVTPLKPLEAMAQGKVCIGSDVGGLTELIHDDDTGVIFRRDSPESLAEAILALADDPTRMVRLRQRALEYVHRERTWNRTAERYLEIYSSLLRSNQAYGE